VPATLTLQASHPTSLQVLFVAPAARREDLEAFAVARGWLGQGALWTTEAPVQTGARYPALVLLSPEGRVLLEGSAAALQADLHATLEGLA
jgi:hypothetical protein